MISPRPALAILLLAATSTAPVLADEGMWLFNDFPAVRFAKLYGSAPSQAELDHLRLASLRFGNGGSGAFVSAEGLVLTNHHVGSDCIQKLSTKDRDLIGNGFTAAKRDAELPCPDLELLNLLAIRRVTAEVKAAEAGTNGAAEATRARRRTIAALESACTTSPKERCEVVTLFGGAEFDLYHYRRFTDVRLAFAPEGQAAQFGGDPDNFDFPRFALDFALFRVYEGGVPFRPQHHLAWSPQGIEEGEVAFISGHPGSTRREQTVAQLEYLRDHYHPAVLAARDGARQVLEAYSARGEEEARIAGERWRGVTNSLKANAGFQAGLLDPEIWSAKQTAEAELKATVAADPALAARFGDPWAEIAAAQQNLRTFETRYRLLESEFAQSGSLLSLARQIVRLAYERERPDGERFSDYRDAARATLERKIFSNAPIYPSYEEAQLTAYLWRLRAQLGVTHPLVMKALGRTAPEELAKQWIAGTKLGDVDARKALVAGEKGAVQASDDPLIRLAEILEPLARELKRRFEEEVEGVELAAGARLAALRLLAGKGQEVYPDATFSLRLSYGRALSYDEGGRPVPWKTTFRELWERVQERKGAAPWNLPPRIAAARERLSPATPVNFASTHDSTGGNSGSPVVDRQMRVVGVLFDGNLYSLANRFVFSERRARSLSVDSRAMEEVLRKVYGAGHLAAELTGRQ